MQMPTAPQFSTLICTSQLFDALVNLFFFFHEKKKKKKSNMGDPRSRRRRIAAVSNPKGEAVRVAQGISNATSRQTATELQ